MSKFDYFCKDCFDCLLTVSHYSIKLILAPSHLIIIKIAKKCSIANLPGFEDKESNRDALLTQFVNNLINSALRSVQNKGLCFLLLCFDPMPFFKTPEFILYGFFDFSGIHKIHYRLLRFSLILACLNRIVPLFF